MSVDIRFSPMTLGLVALLHLLAAAASLCLQLPGELIALLLLAVSRSALRLVREYGPHSCERITRIRLSQQLALVDTEGDTLRCDLPRLLFLSEFLTVLEFVEQPLFGKLPAKSSRKILLLPDTLSRSDYCRLQRYLRFRG